MVESPRLDESKSSLNGAVITKYNQFTRTKRSDQRWTKKKKVVKQQYQHSRAYKGKNMRLKELSPYKVNDFNNFVKSQYNSSNKTFYNDSLPQFPSRLTSQ